MKISIRSRLSIFYYAAIIFFIIWLFYPYFRDLYRIWVSDFLNTFGYLAPLVSVWAIYYKRREIKAKKTQYSFLGWPFLVAGLSLAVLYRWSMFTLWACLGLPLVIFGICLIIFGRDRSRYLIFPVFFLLLMYPWGDLLNTLIGFQLRRISVISVFFIFNIMGMEAAISGTMIFTGRFLVNVAPACSGLTMMNVLLFFSIIGAYLYRGKAGPKILIIISIIPLAIILNTLRVISTGLIGHFLGEEQALGFYHNLSGMLVFGLAMLFLYCETAVLKKIEGYK